MLGLSLRLVAAPRIAGTRPTSSICCVHSWPLLASARRCSTVPTEEEVVKAYGVLGVATSGTFADVKKRYVDLAKEHHPDVAGAAPAASSDNGGGDTPGSRMVDINDAYRTVSRFHKAGRRLSPAGPAGASTTSSSSWQAGAHPHQGGQAHRHHQQQQNYYTGAERGYQPWHEDLDPLLYEMMWEEMRRQNASDPFERAMDPDEFYSYAHERPPQDFARGSYRPPRQHGPRQEGGRKKSGAAEGKPDTARESAKTTTWPEADLRAMVNMYQEGKSFEFIGNALGKETGQVVEEFNRWSDDSKKSGQHQGRNSRDPRNRRRGRRHHPAKGAYYHMEYPTGPPYGFYDFMVEDDEFDDAAGDGDDTDPYGYHVGDDYGHYEDPWQGDEDGPSPYTGTHRMSGAPGGAPHSHRSSSPRGSGGADGGGYQQRGNRNGSGGAYSRKQTNFFRHNHNRNFKNRGKR